MISIKMSLMSIRKSNWLNVAKRERGNFGPSANRPKIGQENCRISDALKRVMRYRREESTKLLTGHSAIGDVRREVGKADGWQLAGKERRTVHIEGAGKAIERGQRGQAAILRSSCDRRATMAVALGLLRQERAYSRSSDLLGRFADECQEARDLVTIDSPTPIRTGTVKHSL